MGNPFKILKVKNLRSSILYLYPSTKQLILLLFPDGVINGLSTWSFLFFSLFFIYKYITVSLAKGGMSKSQIWNIFLGQELYRKPVFTTEAEVFIF